MVLVKRLKASVMKKSRAEKLENFYSMCSTDANVLDVGVTNNEHNEQVNLFLNTFRFDSNQYTGLAIEPLKKIRKKHPDKKFVEYPGGKFPFEDKSFDWAFSNAVIEHVGNEQEQVNFINKMLRVSKKVFFTTPNKYFPVEAHTNTIFRHWFSKSFYEWCKRNKLSWNERNLVLLSYRDLYKLMKKSGAIQFRIKKNRLLLMPMTFTIICTG